MRGLRAVGGRVKRKEDMLCQRCSGLLICEDLGEYPLLLAWRTAETMLATLTSKKADHRRSSLSIFPT